MTKVIVKDYYHGNIVKEIKLNAKAQGRSITYGVEWVGGNQRFIIRDYYTNDKLQTCDANSWPSVEFWTE